MKVKGKMYKSVVRPALLYGAECWAVSKKQEQQLKVAEMRMLRWSLGVTRKDRMENEYVRGAFGVCGVEENLRVSRLRWFGHVMRMEEDEVVSRVRKMKVGGIRRSGRPKLT